MPVARLARPGEQPPDLGPVARRRRRRRRDGLADVDAELGTKLNLLPELLLYAGEPGLEGFGLGLDILRQRAVQRDALPGLFCGGLCRGESRGGRVGVGTELLERLNECGLPVAPLDSLGLALVALSSLKLR